MVGVGEGIRVAVGEGKGVAVGEGMAVLVSAGNGVASGVGVARGEIGGAGTGVANGDEGLEITIGNFVVFITVLVAELTGAGGGLGIAPAIDSGVLVSPADTCGKKL